MSTIKYKLNKDIISRTAAQLNWNLNQIKSCVKIRNNDRVINGKSLVGILSGNMKMGDIITITIDEPTDLDYIKQQFNEIGREING